MPGRAAMTSLAAVKSDMESVKGGGTAGVTGSENSEIMEGRKGASGHGTLDSAATKDVCSMLGGAMAKKGGTDPNMGNGKTL